MTPKQFEQIARRLVGKTIASVDMQVFDCMLPYGGASQSTPANQQSDSLTTRY